MGARPGHLLDDTRRTLGRQAQAVLATPACRSDASRGSGNGCSRRPRQLGLPLGLGLLGCVGLGVGLGYLLEPQGGPQRRAWLREKARAYWQTTETLLSSAVPNGVHPPERRRREAAHAAHQT